MAGRNSSGQSARGVSKPPRSRAFFLEMLLNMLLMALCVMVLVQVFAESRLISGESAALTRLSLEGQSLAEHYKATGANTQTLQAAAGLTGGELSADGTLTYFYNNNLESAAGAMARYRLVVSPGGDANLASITIEAFDGQKDSGTPLFSYHVSYHPARGVS